MATWTYSDYITLDGAARLTRLRLHIKEVTDSLRDPASVASDGHSMSKDDLDLYVQGLKREELEMRNQIQQVGGFIRQRFVPPGC